jgi:hypothetical protein
VQIGGQPNPTTPDTGKTPPTEKLPEVAVEAVPVRVKVFGGEQVELSSTKAWKYFEVGDRPREKADIGGVEAEVRLQKQASMAGVVIVYTFDPSASKRTEGYIQLAREAERLGVPLVSEDELKQIRKR